MVRSTSALLTMISPRVVQVLQGLVERLRGVTWTQWFKAYGVFAVLHTFAKVFHRVYWTKKVMKKLSHLPGYDIDITCKDFMENMNRLHDWRYERMKKFEGQPLVRTSAPDVELICNTPGAVQDLLKTEFKKVSKPSRHQDYGFQLLGEFLGDEGIFVLQHGAASAKDDKMWYKQRKTAAKIFTRGRFNSVVSKALGRKLDLLIDNLSTFADKNEGIASDKRTEGATAVDMQEKFFCFTFDLIQEMFFNRKVDSISGQMDEFAQAFDDGHRALLKFLIKTTPLNVANSFLLPFPFGSLYPNGGERGWFSPMWQVMKMFNPDYQEMRRNIAILDKYCYQMAKDTRLQDLEDRHDMLSFFLKNHPDLTDKQLRDIILNFIIAGRDTTACLLTWFAYELTQHPECQKKLMQEIDEKLGGEKPTLSSVSPENMPYLHACMMATLQMHPPVPEDSKISCEECNIQGTTVPPGVKLTFCPYAIGRRKSETWDPEVWLPYEKFDLFEFPVFQAGQRFCLGMNLAQFEAKATMSRILQKFSLAFEGNEDPSNITYALMITSSLCNAKDQSSNNLWIVPRHRTDAPPVVA